MQENNPHASTPINRKMILAGMILVFIIVQVGFHATYIKYFPTFTKFKWVHHIHGALMAAWVILLFVQPLLIFKQKFTIHRFLGKLSYVLAPLMFVSMILIAKQNYQSGLLKKSVVDVMANQSITWLQILLFALFYSLAIYFRKKTVWHMRFMIGTAILMLGPPMNRILVSYFPEMGVSTILPLVLGLKTAVAACLLIGDVAKKSNWIPYGIVLGAFLFADLVFVERYAAPWQSIGNLIVRYLYQ